MMIKKIILPGSMVLAFISCSISQKSFNKLPAQNISAASPQKDTIRKLKSYNEVITDKAVTQKGLLTIHKVGEKYYFEIANSFLNKDILIVNRISKGADMFRSAYGDGYGGDYIGENIVKFVKGPNQKLFIERSAYIDRSRDSSQNGMYESVLNSSLPAIVASFDITAVSSDSTRLIVDMTNYLNGDNEIFFFNARRTAFALGALQPDKSYIKSITSFPINTEIRTIKTYSGEDKQMKTFELNSSIVLLPSQPMKTRSLDNRVGYFSRGYRDFDAPQGVEAKYMITRWRLEPKEEDVIKYKNGQLVEPQKPIVFYIDPATPKKWVPYLIKGVNAWQKAFEKAGFKNAIYALEAPANDSTWSLEDASHSAIVYKASDIPNASGPHISDPRSGEILESHINWYHNVQQLLHDWYMIQAGPNDPRARKMQFDDSLMGRLIEFVCTHEVGHTLGLRHNFAASSMIPVDSLRSRQYVAVNSHTPSIMDYARFNYVAQPEDSIAVKDLIPRIGVYDEWAIEWGYKWLPDLKTNEEENAFLKKWIIERQAKDKLVFFSDDIGDARSRIEDIGDDPIKAGYYGIKNLKVVISHLAEWTREPGKDYAYLKRLSNSVFDQYTMYIRHTWKYISGQYFDEKTGDQEGPVWTFVSKEKQRAAVQFLQEQLFDTPTWLFNRDIFDLCGKEFVVQRQKFIEYVLAWMIWPGRAYNSLLFNETNQSPDKVYDFNQLLNDLEIGIWKELKNHDPIDLNRRMVQKTYVFGLVHYGARVGRALDFSLYDYCTIINDHIKSLCQKIKCALPRYTDNTSKSHLQDLLTRLNQALIFQKTNFPDNPYLVTQLAPVPGPKSTFSALETHLLSHDSLSSGLQKTKSCWRNEIEW